VFEKLPGFKFEVIPILSQGDKDKKTPLAFKEGSNFFTYEIEQALLEGRIDLAVHSAKDLEDNPPPGLVIAALTDSLSRFDCLVAAGNFNLDSLPPGSRIGTSSQNRKQAISKYRNDLVTLDIRGNVPERLFQLDRGNFEAVIVAEAALKRLGLEKRISQVIPLDILEPHFLQGRLAIQVRDTRKDLLKIFRSIDVS